jgi:hypothetical protein
MTHLQGRKLIAFVAGLLIELAPAYVLLLPRFLGIVGYVSIFFALSMIVGLISASITSSVGYPAIATALGKLVCDTLLGWRIDENVLSHLLILGIVAGCAAGSATIAHRFLFSDRATPTPIETL